MKHTVAVEPLEKPRRWRLLEDFTVGPHTVPKGFVTDGASIPIGLRWLFPHGGAKFPAAVMHDWMYRNRIGTRRHADKTFLRIMLENGVLRWKAKAMYWSVRFGGHWCYGK